MNIVIIGGGAAGMSAASKARRMDKNARITVLEKTGYVSYAECGMPYYLSGYFENKVIKGIKSLYAKNMGYYV